MCFCLFKLKKYIYINNLNWNFRFILFSDTLRLPVTCWMNSFNMVYIVFAAFMQTLEILQYQPYFQMSLWMSHNTSGTRAPQELELGPYLN